MNLELSDDQRMLRDTFARFLDSQSSMARVRAAEETNGFDAEMWVGLAELGAFSIRLPEEQGGLGMGLLDAAVLMEEAGRTLVSGPLAETLVAVRVLGLLGDDAHSEILESVVSGEQVLSIARHDLATAPRQWIAGGAVANAVIARDGDKIVLLEVPEADRVFEANLASTAIAELDLAASKAVVLAEGAAAIRVFEQALEEWKLLMAITLSGLSTEAVRLASEYACERKAFGQFIGTYQGISHPLADCIVDVDGGKYFVWRVIHDLEKNLPGSAAKISMALWWNIRAAGRTVRQSLQTFGGYGLTTEYDIYLYNLRAKAWPLIFGDPDQWLTEAGQRLYGEIQVALPDVGEVSIDFSLGEDADRIAQELDELFTEILTPELRAKAHYSWDGYVPEVHQKLAAKGLLNPEWPEELGGRGITPYTAMALSRVWEKHNWSSHALGTTRMVGAIIHRYGSDELKEQVLSKIIKGEVACSLGYSEPSAGSDVFAAQTRAVRDGDEWVINGSKMFTSGANLADYVILVTRTNTEVAKHRGLTMFLVPLDAPGIDIHPVYTFQDERTNITYYDNVRVKDSYRLGEVDGGTRVMALALELEHGASFVNHQWAMVEAAEELCREICVNGQMLIDSPDAQRRLARTTLHNYLAEVLQARSLWASVEKLPNKGFGSMVKLFSSETFVSDSADLLDLTAPLSLSKREGAAEFLNVSYRHAQGTAIYAGTSQIHRSQIAEGTLGLPRSRA